MKSESLLRVSIESKRFPNGTFEVLVFTILVVDILIRIVRIVTNPKKKKQKYDKNA